jgi:serine/threonine-protein kinase
MVDEDDFKTEMDDELLSEPEYGRLVAFAKGLSSGAGDSNRQDDKLPRDFGHYELKRVLGRGDTGRVYLATQDGSDRKFAVKILRRELSRNVEDTEQMMQRFRRDSRAAAVIDDSRLLVAIDVGEFEQRVFYTMNYVDGITLSKLIKTNKLSNRRTAETVKGVAEALHKLHNAGICHRQLQPGNVMLGSSNKPYLLGVGVSSLIQHLAGTNLQLTEGYPYGLVDFVSPEQVTDPGFVDVAAEIWSLGAIIYDCLVGEPPFRSGDIDGTKARIQRDAPTSLTRQNPRVAKDLETICFKCLNKNPSRRYSSANELARDLGRFLEYEPIEARPNGFLERGRNWTRRMRFKTV